MRSPFTQMVLGVDFSWTAHDVNGGAKVGRIGVICGSDGVGGT